MFVKAYLDVAATIISQYTGVEPLAAFLKKFFAAEKQFGSRDRKQISNLVFCYFRLGAAMEQASLQERLLAGLFLCNPTPQPVLQQVMPDWNKAIAASLNEKIALLKAQLNFHPENIFPFTAHLSPVIEKESFAHSFLMQPFTYLRLRPGRELKVINQLEGAGLDFTVLSETCVALQPAAKLDELLMLDRDAVVQDRNSQQVLSLLTPLLNKDKKFTVWDCCAASGGKSIQLHDQFPGAKLTVSDIRPSILINLRKRFERAALKGYQWFVGDLSDVQFQHNTLYDVVLCDAPCSGSGTWSRTPEWLCFFPEEKVTHYANLQRKISGNVAQQVKPGGLFLYITCSVFWAENESVVQHLQQECGLHLEQAAYFKGYGQRSDTLFAALLRKP